MMTLNHPSAQEGKKDALSCGRRDITGVVTGPGLGAWITRPRSRALPLGTGKAAPTHGGTVGSRVVATRPTDHAAPRNHGPFQHRQSAPPAGARQDTPPGEAGTATDDAEWGDRSKPQGPSLVRGADTSRLQRPTPHGQTLRRARNGNLAT